MYLSDLVNYREMDPQRRSQAAIALRGFPKHKVLPTLRQAVMSEPVTGVAVDISASINSFGDEGLLDQFLNGRKFNPQERERLTGLFKRGNKTGLKVLMRLVKDSVASVRYQAYDGFIGESPEVALSVLTALPIDPDPGNEARRKALIDQFQDYLRKHQTRSPHTIPSGLDPLEPTRSTLEDALIEYYFSNRKPAESVKELNSSKLFPLSELPKGILGAKFWRKPERAGPGYWAFYPEIDWNGYLHRERLEVPQKDPAEVWYPRLNRKKSGGMMSGSYVDTPENQCHLLAMCIDEVVSQGTLPASLSDLKGTAPMPELAKMKGVSRLSFKLDSIGRNHYLIRVMDKRKMRTLVYELPYSNTTIPLVKVLRN